MANLRRSLFITFFSHSGATAIQFAISLILARLLSPSEIGVYSMTAVFVGIAHVFRDFGVTTYLQREAKLTTEKIRAAIGILFTTSWTLALILFFASGKLAIWFKEPAMEPVMTVLAAGFLFIPFGSITHAFLSREFAADKEVWVMVAGTLSYAVTCLTLAWLGFGTMSLAWANLANIVACGLACIPLRPKGIPWLPSFKNWSQAFHFGLGSLAANCASAINNAIPDLLLGKIGSAREVGLLSRGSSTVAIFSIVAGYTINYGAISYVSQAYNRGESLTPILNRNNTLLTGIGWPILGVTAVFATEIIHALYGAQWLQAAPAVMPLAISAAVTMAFNYTPTALTAIGHPYLSAIPTVLIIVSRIAIGILLFNGSLVSFAWAICLATIVAAPVIAFQQHRYLSYRFKSMVSALIPSALVSLICISAALCLELLLHAVGVPIIKLLVIGLSMIVIWYISIRLVKHPIIGEINHLTNAIMNRLKF